MARPVRVELTTYSFGGCRSIHLSYGRTVAFHKTAAERAHAKAAACAVILTLACIPRQSTFRPSAHPLRIVRGRKFSDLTLCPCPNVVCKFFNFFGFLHQRQREHL